MRNIVMKYGVMEQPKQIHFKTVLAVDWHRLNEAVVELSVQKKQAEDDYLAEHTEVERLEVNYHDMLNSIWERVEAYHDGYICVEDILDVLCEHKKEK